MATSWRSPKPVPKRGPFLTPKSGPERVKADCRPSLFPVRFWVSKTVPFWEPHCVSPAQTDRHRLATSAQSLLLLHIREAFLAKQAGGAFQSLVIATSSPRAPNRPCLLMGRRSCRCFEQRPKLVTPHAVCSAIGPHLKQIELEVQTIMSCPFT